MIKTIIMVGLGIFIGIIVSFPISKILIKRYARKMAENSSEKILKQIQADLQTASGKPVDLNFINDGKVAELKKQVLESLAKTKLKEVKEHEKKVKEIKKSKKEVKKKRKKK